VNRLESARAVEGDRLLIPSGQRAQAPMAKKTVSASARRRTARGKAVTSASARRPVRKSPVVLAHNGGN
jgi:hypothetical protein